MAMLAGRCRLSATLIAISAAIEPTVLVRQASSSQRIGHQVNLAVKHVTQFWVDSKPFLMAGPHI
eukprot:2748875-Pleurochrysis_carterae.AAC.2